MRNAADFAGQADFAEKNGFRIERFFPGARCDGHDDTEVDRWFVNLDAAGETIYFKNPSATKVIDAVRFKGQQNGVATGRYPDGAPGFYRLRSKTSPWRVIDIFIEGVSVVQNFRTQVQEIVSTKGADQLISILREKNDQKAATRS